MQMPTGSSLHTGYNGSEVECFTQDRGATGSSLIGVTTLCSDQHLALIQRRKACPFITEGLLMGPKESDQTNKQTLSLLCYLTRNVL